MMPTHILGCHRAHWLALIVFSIASFFVVPAQAQGSANLGDLVKCPDFTSVYYLGDDGKRYVFPNEKIYKTWEGDFDEVKTISCDDLAKLQIGGNVPYREGTRLVKIPSVPTVYAVEPKGELRAIPDESTAKELFGDEWSDRVDDLPEGFFPHYKMGKPLGENELPEGMMLEDGGELFRVNDKGEAEEIEGALSAEDKALMKAHAGQMREVQERMHKEIAKFQEEMMGVVAEFRARMQELMKTVKVDADAKLQAGAFEGMPEMRPELEGMMDMMRMFEEKMDSASHDWEAVGFDEAKRKYSHVRQQFKKREEFDAKREEMEAFLKSVSVEVRAAADGLHDEEWQGKETRKARRLLDDARRKLDQAFGMMGRMNLKAAEALGQNALAIANRVKGGEGVETLQKEEWQEEHKEKCRDCWWEKPGYSDEEHFGKPQGWEDQWKDERKVDQFGDQLHEDWKQKWDEQRQREDENRWRQMPNVPAPVPSPSQDIVPQPEQPPTEPVSAPADETTKTSEPAVQETHTDQPAANTSATTSTTSDSSGTSGSQ